MHFLVDLDDLLLGLVQTLWIFVEQKHRASSRSKYGGNSRAHQTGANYADTKDL